MTLRQRLATAIASFTEFSASKLAPVIPWLFLALRRALIATLGWVIVAVLFFIVPQSRDVLHGLSEPPLRTVYSLNEEVLKHVNVWSLSAYVITAVILALVLWYSARLLTTVEATQGTPLALTSGAGLRYLEAATTLLPRILGVSALAASVSAMIYANYAPPLAQLSGLAVVFLAVAGPLLIAAGYLMMDMPNRLMARVLLGFGILALLAAAGLLYVNTGKWRVWLWSIGSTALPALLLVFLVKRRTLLSRFKMDAGGAPNAARDFGEIIVTVIAMLLFGVAALLLLALSPAVIVRGFGSAATVLLFLAAGVLLLTAVQLILRRIARNVPGLTTATILIIAVLVALFGKESVGTEALKDTGQAPAGSAGRTSSSAPGASTAQVEAPAKARPLYVNAYGGGLRAAAFTAEVLAQADDATCGKFGERVDAFSGVSGGSLGIATYLLARQELVARGGWPECGPATSPPHAPLTDIVTRALVQDHLSPTIARMLAVDAPHFPGYPVRGQALLDSWQSALVSSLEEGQPGKNQREPLALALRLGELTGGMLRPARVYFNSTNADSGHIIWFSNGDGGIVGDNLGHPLRSAAHVSVGQAVLHSARFPIVSPAGQFALDAAPHAPARLIDGGYADNSGTTTLRRELRASDKTDGPAVLLDIDGNPPDESFCVTTRGNPPILTAVRGLLQARSAHATLAVQQFMQSSGATLLPMQLNLELVYGVKNAQDTEACEKVRRAQQAPLGWYVSYGAAQTIAVSASFGVDRICQELGMTCFLRTPLVPLEK